MTGRKPKALRWLAAVQVMLCLYHVGAILWILQRDNTISVTMSVPLWLQLALNLAWAGAFAWSANQLFYQRPSALNRSFWLFCGFLLFVAIRQLLFVRADYDRNRLPLMLGMTAVIFAIFFIVHRLLAVPKNMEKRLYDNDRSED